MDSFGRIRSLTPDAANLLPHPWLLDYLYRTLIAPLLPYCQDHHRLVLVPHGWLHLLPYTPPETINPALAGLDAA